MPLQESYVAEGLGFREGGGGSDPFKSFSKRVRDHTKDPRFQP